MAQTRQAERPRRPRRRQGHLLHAGHGHAAGAVPPWLARWEWRVVTAIAAAAFVLAFVGLEGGSVWDRLSEALHVFTSGFPGPPVEGEPVEPTALRVAEHLAPLVALYATLRVLVALFADRIVAARLRRRRGHVVIAGAGTKGARIALAYRAAGHQVTAIDVDAAADGPTGARAHGTAVIRGDATRASALAAAAAGRARVVVCACGEDGVNERAAAAALAVERPDGSPLAVWVHVADPELARLLVADDRRPGVRWYCVDDVWSRRILAAVPPLLPGTGDRRLLVVGEGALARTVVLAAARSWHHDARLALADDRLAVVLVGAGAQATAEGLVARHPSLERLVDLDPVDVAPEDAAARLVALLARGPQPDAVVIALADPGAARGTARLVAERLGLAAAPVVLAVPDDRVAVPPGVVAIEPWGDAHDPDALLDGLLDEAGGRAVHEAYARSRAATGVAVPEWDALSPLHRASSQAQFAAIPHHLAAAWLRLGPLLDWDAPAPPLADDEVELLARLEHARFCAERRAVGWRPGPSVDAEARTHPDLVPWDELRASSRATNAAFVAAWPTMLARAGLGVERDPRREAVAAAAHARHATATGADPPVAWARLPEARRRRDLAFAGNVPQHLAAAGVVIAPTGDPAARPLVLQDALVEELSRREHDRWLAERAVEGWVAGPRDDAARVHPDVVPWTELADDRRELDRVLVRALPELLAAAGVLVVPAPADAGLGADGGAG